MDASALADALLHPRGSDAVLDLLADDAAEIVVPHLCDVEVLSVFQNAVRRGHVEVDHALRALEQFLELPLQRFEHPALLRRAFALRENFSAYDALYVALAEGLAAPLVTADARLARAVRMWTDLEVVEVARSDPGAETGSTR